MLYSVIVFEIVLFKMICDVGHVIGAYVREYRVLANKVVQPRLQIMNIE